MSCVPVPVDDCMHSERCVYTVDLSVGVGIASCTNIGTRKQICSTCVHD